MIGASIDIQEKIKQEEFCGAKEEGNKPNFYENPHKTIIHFFEVQYTILKICFS